MGKRPAKTPKDKVVGWINGYTVADWEERLVKVNHFYNFFLPEDSAKFLEFGGLFTMYTWMKEASAQKQNEVLEGLLNLLRILSTPLEGNNDLLTLCTELSANQQLSEPARKTARHLMERLEAPSESFQEIGQDPEQYKETEETPAKKTKTAKGGIRWADTFNRPLEHTLIIKTRKQLELEKRMAEQAQRERRKEVWLPQLNKVRPMERTGLAEWAVPDKLGFVESVSDGSVVGEESESDFVGEEVVVTMPLLSPSGEGREEDVGRVIVFGSEEIAPMLDDEDDEEDIVFKPISNDLLDISSLLSNPALANVLADSSNGQTTAQQQQYRQPVPQQQQLYQTTSRYPPPAHHYPPPPTATARHSYQQQPPRHSYPPPPTSHNYPPPPPPSHHHPRQPPPQQFPGYQQHTPHQQQRYPPPTQHPAQRYPQPPPPRRPSSSNRHYNR